jgi:hypothetical protein
MKRIRLETRYRDAAMVLAGDVIAVLLFVYIGQREHQLVDATNPIWGILKTSTFLVVPWVIAVIALRAWPGREAEIRPFLMASLNAWLVAAPLGVLVRGYALGRAVEPLAFVVATYVFGGLFLLGWRILFAICYARAHKLNAAQV